MSTIRTGVSIASAAAMFALSSLASAATAPQGSSGVALGAADTVHCYGVNSCKGTGDCSTADHSCRGMNECKGHGFKAMAASACLAKKGVIGDLR
jgi:hypothetical protein